MSTSKKTLRKLHKALTRIVGEDEPNYDFEKMRHGFIVSVVVDDDDELAIMSYKVDPENMRDITGQDLGDMDTIGIILTMAHQATPGLLNKIVDKVMQIAPIKHLLDLLKSHAKDPE